MIALRFTLDQKCQELRRELAMRRSVYRRDVANGKMSPQEAANRIAILETILDDYQQQHEPKLPE